MDLETAPSGVVLDFTEEGNLPADFMRRLDAIAESQRTKFNDLLGELSRGRERDIDWWVSRPAGRNTHISILFAQCMQLALVRALLDEGIQPVVRTDRPEMARVLRPVLGAERIVLSGAGGRSRRALRAALWDIASTLFHTLAPQLAALRTRRHAKPLPNSPLTVLETFVYGHSFAEGKFRDFHYPAFYDSLGDARRSRLFYLANFHRVRDYQALLRDMRTLDRNFLVREDYLRWSDYAFAFGHWWRTRRLAVAAANFAGFDVAPLVNAELRAGRFANSAVQALLLYRFWRGARARGLTVDRLVDWYEGQDLDHATAAAINWHAHAPAHLAYRPIAPPSFLSLTPARHEVTSGVVPRLWGVVGGDVRSEIQQANPDLTVIPAPGLRHLRLRSFQRRPQEEERPAVLVLLSHERDLVERLLAAIAPTLRTAAGCRWLIKRHPVMPVTEVMAMLGSLAQAAELVEGDLYDWLERSSAVVGLGTNTLNEAIAAGLPVICVSGGNHPTETPLAPASQAGWWQLCYDASEFAALLPQAVAAAQRADTGADLREALLGPFDVGVMHGLLFDPLPQPRRPEPPHS